MDTGYTLINTTVFVSFSHKSSGRLFGYGMVVGWCWVLPVCKSQNVASIPRSKMFFMSHHYKHISVRRKRKGRTLSLAFMETAQNLNTTLPLTFCQPELSHWAILFLKGRLGNVFFIWVATYPVKNPITAKEGKTRQRKTTSS